MSGNSDLPALRVAVVGLGHYHVTGWVETLEGFPNELEIVALYDPDPELARTLAPAMHDPSLRPSLGERYRKIPVESTLDDLVARHELDIALVTLPNVDAPEAIATLASAGIHLLIDKPASRSSTDARRAAEHVDASGVRTVVGLTRRYSPAFQAARAAIMSGELGRLVAAEAVSTTSSVAVRNPRNYLFDWEQSGGGVLSWLGVHDVDTLQWLAGEPITAVAAMTGRIGLPGLEVEDVASVVVGFASGAVGVIQQSYSLPARGHRGHLAFRGLDGSLEIGLEGELVFVHAVNGELRETRRTVGEPSLPGYGFRGRAAVADLVAAVRLDRDTEAPLSVLLGALDVVDAAYESARTGRHVRLPPGDDRSGDHRL